MVMQHRHRFLKREQVVRLGPVRLNCYLLVSLDVNGLKSLLSALDVKADRIYDAVGPAQRIRECGKFGNRR